MLDVLKSQFEVAAVNQRFEVENVEDDWMDVCEPCLEGEVGKPAKLERASLS